MITQMQVERKPANGESCHFCRTKKGGVYEIQSGGGLVVRICPSCLDHLNRKTKE